MKRWFAMAAQFTKDAKIEQLGEELGPGGPLALVVLMGQAKMQANGGRVEGTFRDLGHDAFIDRPDAQRAIERAAEIGVIEVESTDERGFVAVFPRWRHYQEAHRKQESGRSDAQTRADARKDAIPVRDKDKDKDRTETRTTSTSEPSDFPPFLAPLSDTLNRVAEGKGAARPKPHLVIKAFTDYSDRDLAAELPEWEHWWLHGKGSRKQMKDPVGALRRWLRRSDPVSQNGREHKADRRIRELEGIKQRLAQEAA